MDKVFIKINFLFVRKVGDMRTEIYSLKRRFFCTFCKRSIRAFCNGKAKSYYDVLGVDRNASQNDIKKAFYTLSKKYHPDVVGESNKAAADKFLEVKEAYDILKDENHRREYDQQLDNYGFFGGEPHSSQSFYQQQHRDQQYNRNYEFYRHVRRPPPSPNGRNPYSNDDFHRIWQAMQNNKDFQRASRDLNDYLRKARERAFNEYAKRREDRYQNFSEEELRKNSFTSPNPFRNRNSPWNTKIVHQVLSIYCAIFLIATLYQYFRPKPVIYYEDSAPEKSSYEKIRDMINRPPGSR